eukprot:440798-Hanusia_phi.AAC.7
MSARTDVEKLLEEVQITSKSWLGDELISALSSEDLEGVDDEFADGQDSDLEDISSLTFSDISLAKPSKTKADEDLRLQSSKSDQKKGEKDEIIKLRTQLEELRNQNEILEFKLNHAHRRREEDVNQMRERQLKPALEKISQLERMRYKWREDDQIRKEDFIHALEISQKDYHELRSISPDNRDLKQDVAIHVWERIDEVQKGRTAARKEADALRESLKLANAELRDVHGRWEESEKIANAKFVEYSQNVRIWQDKCSNLQRNLDALNEEMALHEERSRRCDEAEVREQRAAQELNSAANRVGELESVIANLQNEMKNVMEDSQEKTRVSSILQLDKDYLQKENADLLLRCQKAEEKLEKKTFKVKELQRNKEQLELQMREQQIFTVTSNEERIQSQIAALQERAHQEIGEIKKNTAEFYERQNHALLDAKEEALSELERVRKRLSDVEKAKEIAVREHMELVSTFESRVGEARSQAKIKAAELERAHIAQEEAQALIRQLRIEAEMYREKVELLRTELSSLQTSSATRITELEAQVTNNDAKLKLFESIENDLASMTESMEGSLTYPEYILQSDSQALGKISSYDHSRRIAQALSLARKVMEQQKEMATLRKTIEEQDSHIARISAELSQTSSLLSKSPQPQDVLIQAICSRDEELKLLRAEVKSIKSVHNLVKEERDALSSQCEQLKSDLEKLSRVKKASEGVQAAIGQLQFQQEVMTFCVVMPLTSWIQLNMQKIQEIRRLETKSSGGFVELLV